MGSLGPVIGVASGGLMGLASSFGTAAAGAGAFGALAISNISGVSKRLPTWRSSSKAGRNNRPERACQDHGEDQGDSGKSWRRRTEGARHLGGLQSKLARDSSRNAKPILKTFTNSLNSFKSVLNTLRPMFKSVAAAGLELSESFQKSLNAPDVQKFSII
ncbi:hypothetical protein PO124_31585 [Bacillus licheniformis]|nr:hypothetical protein [Bacillus licheniformis]